MTIPSIKLSQNLVETAKKPTYSYVSGIYKWECAKEHAVTLLRKISIFLINHTGFFDKLFFILTKIQ